MRILSKVLGFGAVLLAAPLAMPPAAAAPLSPYHLASSAGHDALQLADWSGRDDDWDDWDDRDHDHDHDDDGDDDHRRGDWRHGDSRGPGHWGPGHWHPGAGWNGGPQFAYQALPVWVVEQRLRRQHVHPIGRIILSRGLYLVPVLDPYGRRILLAVDPRSADLLGRAQHW